MRIIAGKKRGMKLFSHKGLDTRPITDRVKESLFSVLYKYDLPEGKAVADLFCGTGSLGLEALSRGARYVVFVEKSGEVVKTLNRNIAKAGFVAESKVIRANAFNVGAPAANEVNQYDLVFVDPPYRMTEQAGEDSDLAGLLNLLCEQLADGAVVVVRTNKKTNLLEEYGKLSIIDRRQWGTMAVVLLQKNR